MRPWLRHFGRSVRLYREGDGRMMEGRVMVGEMFILFFSVLSTRNSLVTFDLYVQRRSHFSRISRFHNR